MGGLMSRVNPGEELLCSRCGSDILQSEISLAASTLIRVIPKMSLIAGEDGGPMAQEYAKYLCYQCTTAFAEWLEPSLLLDASYIALKDQAFAEFKEAGL